jgi:hypothetical protein
LLEPLVPNSAHDALAEPLAPEQVSPRLRKSQS